MVKPLKREQLDNSQLIITLELFLENIKALNILLSQNAGQATKEMERLKTTIGQLPFDKISKDLNFFRDAHSKLAIEHSEFQKQHTGMEKQQNEVLSYQNRCAAITYIIESTLARIADTQDVHIRKEDIDFVLSEIIINEYKGIISKKKWAALREITFWAARLVTGAGLLYIIKLLLTLLKKAAI